MEADNQRETETCCCCCTVAKPSQKVVTMDSDVAMKDLPTNPLVFENLHVFVTTLNEVANNPVERDFGLISSTYASKKFIRFGEEDNKLLMGVVQMFKAQKCHARWHLPI